MPAGRLVVQVVPCLRDNYAFVAVDQTRRLSWLIDAPEARPILAHLDAEGLHLQAILATHHHPDHVGAIEAIRDARRAELEFVLAFEGERARIPQATHYCEANTDTFVDTVGYRMLKTSKPPGGGGGTPSPTSGTPTPASGATTVWNEPKNGSTRPPVDVGATATRSSMSTGWL